jgi:hypothetical protein
LAVDVMRKYKNAPASAGDRKDSVFLAFYILTAQRAGKVFSNLVQYSTEKCFVKHRGLARVDLYPEFWPMFFR